MQISRRNLIVSGSGLTLAGLIPKLALSKIKSTELVDDKKGLLDLPAGFSYQVLSQMGDKMSDGYLTPGLPDGLACFAGAGQQIILMRNHELDPSPVHWGSPYPVDAIPKEAYSKDQIGGVTRVVYDTKQRKLVSSNLVLAGTAHNCAGGSSPWGWLTCEEMFDDSHGFVFLCDTKASTVQPPKRIDAYGKFYHEAVAIDPMTCAAYLTEDRPDGCFYRFMPKKKEEPFGKGILAALAIKGKSGFDTTRGIKVGEPMAVEWIPASNVTPKQDDLRMRVQADGAAKICRGEGIFLHGQQVFFTATEGGVNGIGQIWQYDISTEALTLVFESRSKSQLNMPDNIAVHPSGRLFICEDGQSGEVPYLRVMDNNGDLKAFARNRKSDSEFAGVCFAPDGETMFVNSQSEGLTLAVHGPFSKFIQS
jgi:secreted PhoX family phosphatase